MRKSFVAMAVLVALLVALLGVARGDMPLSARRAPAASPSAVPAVRIGALPPSEPLEIALVLRGQDPAGLRSTLAAISDPHSLSYRHFLSPSAYGERFGPPAAAYTLAMRVLRTAGFHVEEAKGAGSMVRAQGTAAQVEALFGVALDAYRAPDGEQYYTARSLPRVPSALVPYISGVLGLDSRDHLQSHPLLRRRAAQEGDTSGLTPADLARAYDLGPLQSSGLDGTGQTIAFAEIDRFHQSDISAYDRAFGLSAPAVQVISVAGGTRATDPETTLDIEVAQAIAPRAHLIAYESGADLAHLAQMFSQIVSDHKAQIVSVSLGACELGISGADAQSFANSLDATFQQADAEGISVLVASGDSGAYGCQSNALSVSLPASNPYVTAVGGTTLFLNSGSAYGHEAGWEGPLEGAGSGGGLSQVYQRPSWQSGTGVQNSASNGMRQVPDVAADADPLTGYRIYASGWQIVGGTSAAAPLWAGLIALANQRAAGSGKPPLGFLNPPIYALAGSSSSSLPFHDVTLGGNLYYAATPGWDYATGWGTPDGAALVQALVAR
jgi:kumamolisin